MVGTSRAQVVSPLQTFFQLIFLPASDGHFADDTNQYWLVDGSEPTRQDQCTQNLLKCLGEPLIISKYR